MLLVVNYVFILIINVLFNVKSKISRFLCKKIKNFNKKPSKVKLHCLTKVQTQFIDGVHYVCDCFVD